MSKSKTPSFVNFLRIWLSFVAVMAIGTTVQGFVSPSYLFDRIYTVDEKNVSDLTARLFGVWTLLAGVVRLLCALDIYNKTLYYVSLFSFLVALCHFLSEVIIYQTAALTAGIIAPLIVSSLSVILMVVGCFIIESKDFRAVCENENQQILNSNPKKLK